MDREQGGCRWLASPSRRSHGRWLRTRLLGAALLLVPLASLAQETVCARVKIEIKQELTLERQAFDAEMRINNTTDTSTIEEVSVVVKITDENGVPVPSTSDPNDTSAKFFIRVSGKEAIGDIDGAGSVAPKTTAVINWLIIPAPGSAGAGPLGKKYLVGATLQYRFGGELQTLAVSPDVITVKPLPSLALDYFLTTEVESDDPLTDTIEPTVPFTLGVRVKNNGYAVAKNLKIDSAQPKIVENNQGLLIGFKLTGSYVDDAPVANSLLTSFGDIAPNTAKIGRWLMETTLAGRFTEFTARFSHSDELGGAVTSLIEAARTHPLIRDVRVDLPGRDMVKDFLAQDGDVTRVYESEGTDTEVTDRSSVAQLTTIGGAGDKVTYKLQFPPTAGFIFVKLPDPFQGQKALGLISRSDAKTLLPDNAWLSRNYNPQTRRIEFWVNFFDVNSPGVYSADFDPPPATARAPQIQLIADQRVRESKQVSFLVQANSPDGKAVSLSAAPLPVGAKFSVQPPSAASPGSTDAYFDWTPAHGSAGNYVIAYTATDGQLSSTRSAAITVDAYTPPAGPGIPQIVAPLSGAQVAALRPTFAVQASTIEDDPTQKMQFEVYRDEALTQLVGSVLVPNAPGGTAAPPTEWRIPSDLNDNTSYWWRARAYDGTSKYSAWANGTFFVNLFNDPPASFNLTNPAPNVEVTSLQPALSWNNSTDADGDALSYLVEVFTDAALSDLVASAKDLPAGAEGTTSWIVGTPLTNHLRYYWRVTAKDALAAQTPSFARPFTVNTGNTAPTSPTPLSPPPGGQTTTPTTALVVGNSTDAENDPITDAFELDTVNTFDSGSRQISPPIPQAAGSTISWTVRGLVENQRYFWRVKAQDGRSESPWAVASFLMNAVNEAPPAPTIRNPGNGAWTSSQQPTLEANPVIDPERSPVHYEFEVYRDAALSNRVAAGASDNTAWIVPVPLADRTTHWWRVRAADPEGAASAWSAPATLYVSTGPYQAPTIQMTAPATITVPTRVTTPQGVRRQVTISWAGNDPNIEPTIALYYDNDNKGFDGTLIVDGLKQAAAGSHSGSYVWDVTALPLGTYRVYGVIYDAKGLGRAYAAGSVLILGSLPAGSLDAVPTDGSAITALSSSAVGPATPASEKLIRVKLRSAPTAEVTVNVASSNSRAVRAEPASLVFTPLNWKLLQTVTVTRLPDCFGDGDTVYEIAIGKTVSLDPDYAAVEGLRFKFANKQKLRNAPQSSDVPDLHVCNIRLINSRKLAGNVWEYELTAELANTGPLANDLQAQLIPSSAAGFNIVGGTLVFGGVGTGEVAKSRGTLVLRSSQRIPEGTFDRGANFLWHITKKKQ